MSPSVLRAAIARGAVAVGLAACHHAAATTAGGPREACAPVAGVDALLAPGTIAIFGELHGTAQSPALVGDVVCHAVAAGRPVTLGLELTNTASATLDGFVHAMPGTAARARLLGDSIWRPTLRDGRTSAAMVALVERAQALVARGADVRLVAFSRDAASGQVRDSAMARELAAAARSDPRRVTIVLTGNIHSRIAPGTSFDSTFSPMGFLLRALLPDRRVVGLDVVYPGGTAWVCLSGETTPCGAHAMRGRGGVPPRAIVFPAPDPRHYDGAYGVDTLRASPPAVP